MTTPRPLPDSIFEAGAPNKYAIAPQSAAAAARTMAAAVDDLTRALGVDETELIESFPVDGGDHADTSVVAAGLGLRTSFTFRRHRDLSVFLISGQHYDGTELRGRHERLLVQRGGLSVCEVLVCTSPKLALAGHDAIAVDMAHVRLTSGLDTMLGGPLTAIVEALRVPPPIARDPNADLVGVDLGGGRVVQQSNDVSAIEWTLSPTPALGVRDMLATYIAQCFARFELGPVPALDTTTTRTWNCAAGAAPPDCPYSDLTRSVAKSGDGRVRITLSSVQAHWTADDVDHVSVTLDMRTATDRLRVVASGRTGSDCCTTLRVARPTSGAAVEALWRTFASSIR